MAVVTATPGRGSKAKGAAFQSLIKGWFEWLGWGPTTRPNRAPGDDIRLERFPLFSLELKNRVSTDLAGWWGQAQANADGRIPVLVHKRKGKALPQDQWVTMTLEEFVRLAKLVDHLDLRRWREMLEPEKVPEEIKTW